MNERCLRYRDVRLIGSDGAQLGIYQTKLALKMAKDEGLDLVMVAPTAVPPVCRIIDYGKHKYDLEKQKKRGSDTKQKDTKQLKLGPATAQHDIEVLEKKARNFLDDGHKVRFTCQFRARAIAHPEIGKAKLDQIAEAMADLAVVEMPSKLEGKLMSMVLAPKKH